MRAASARKSILHGGKDVDVEKYATEPQEEYQIVLQSADMAPFARHDEKFFQANAFLQPKKVNRKYFLPASSMNATQTEFWSPPQSSSSRRKPRLVILRFLPMKRALSSTASSNSLPCWRVSNRKRWSMGVAPPFDGSRDSSHWRG